MCKRITVNGLPVVIGTLLFLGIGPAQGGNPALQGYHSGPGADGFSPPPSYFGYPLDDFAAGYYGGGRYREYYAFGRGYGLATFPGPLAWPGVPPDYRGPRKYDPALYGPPPAVERMPMPQAGRTNVDLLVQAPADAEIWLDGVKTQQTGTARHFESPALKMGGVYTYEIRVRWMEQGRAREQTQVVLVHAGQQVQVSFPAFPEMGPQAAPQRFPLAADQAGQLSPQVGRELIKNP